MVYIVIIGVRDATAARRARLRRTAAIAGLAAAVAGFAWVSAVVPPFVAFVFAVGGAAGYCVWLDKSAPPHRS